MKRLVIRNSKTIRKKAYEFLRERVLDGEIPPDVRLVETKIAAQIGTSRTPVREALHNLELEGLLKAIPRVGYVVVATSEEDLEEICEIRAVIESLAARRAVKKAQLKLVAELGKNIADQEERVNKGEFGALWAVCWVSRDNREIGEASDCWNCPTLRRHVLIPRPHLQKRNGPRSDQRPQEDPEGLGGDLNEITDAIHVHMEESREECVSVSRTG
jgi:DNA-binding transcriptional regulator YhcF (GntR family)